jgi:hypothetical protein
MQKILIIGLLGAVKEVPDSARGRRPASDRLYRDGQTLKTKKSRGNSNGTPRLLYWVYDNYTTLQMDLGWHVLNEIPRDELLRVKPEFIGRYFDPARSMQP